MKNIKSILFMCILTLTLINIEQDTLGNIQNVDVPYYNIITEKDDIIVTQLKYEAQIKALLEFLDASI